MTTWKRACDLKKTMWHTDCWKSLAKVLSLCCDTGITQDFGTNFIGSGFSDLFCWKWSALKQIELASDNKNFKRVLEALRDLLDYTWWQKMWWILAEVALGCSSFNYKLKSEKKITKINSIPIVLHLWKLFFDTFAG